MRPLACLKVHVDPAHAPNGFVQAQQGNEEHPEISLAHPALADRLLGVVEQGYQQQGPNSFHEWRGKRLQAKVPEIDPGHLSNGPPKPVQFELLHGECLDDALAADALLKNLGDLPQLLLAGPAELPHELGPGSWKEG